MGIADKVALVVIDGMSYWQYLVLDRWLNSKYTHKDTSLAWLSITRPFDRFRGWYAYGELQSESNGWKKTVGWILTEKAMPPNGMNAYEIDYIDGSLFAETIICANSIRGCELWMKMASSSNNKDLYSLTENWAKRLLKASKHCMMRNIQCISLQIMAISWHIIMF